MNVKFLRFYLQYSYADLLLNWRRQQSPLMQRLIEYKKKRKWFECDRNI